MDDISEIENRMREASSEGVADESSSPPIIPTAAAVMAEESTPAPVSVALDKAALAIVKQAEERVVNQRSVNRHAKALEKNANDRISNEIDRQSVENERRKADNEIDRKELANKLYRIKEESKRLKAEQKHLSEMQKQEQAAEKKRAYWESHKAVLEQYGMHEGSSRISCAILLFLDGIKCFFLGLAKVSDALVKAIKWILIIGVIVGILMAIPVTRTWILTLLGFV